MQQGKGDVLFHHADRNTHAFGDLRLAQAFEAVQHKGFSPAGREFGEDFFQLFQALEALGGGQGIVLLVADRFGIPFGLLVMDAVAHLLFAPMVAQQVARHLKQKGPWLLDLGPVAVYFIDAEASAQPDSLPIGGLTVIKFRDTHMVYALTWYALAAMVATGLAIMLKHHRRARRRWAIAEATRRPEG